MNALLFNIKISNPIQQLRIDKILYLSFYRLSFFVKATDITKGSQNLREDGIYFGASNLQKIEMMKFVKKSITFFATLI